MVGKRDRLLHRGGLLDNGSQRSLRGGRNGNPAITKLGYGSIEEAAMKRIGMGVSVLMLAMGMAAALHRALAQPSTPSPLAAQALPAEAFPQSDRLEEGPLSPRRSSIRLKWR